MKHESLDHSAVKPRPERGIRPSLEEEAQRHQVDAHRAHRARVLAVGVLDGVSVDDELVKRHPRRV